MLPSERFTSCPGVQVLDIVTDRGPYPPRERERESPGNTGAYLRLCEETCITKVLSWSHRTIQGALGSLHRTGCSGSLGDIGCCGVTGSHRVLIGHCAMQDTQRSLEILETLGSLKERLPDTRAQGLLKILQLLESLEMQESRDHWRRKIHWRHRRAVVNVDTGVTGDTGVQGSLETVSSLETHKPLEKQEHRGNSAVFLDTGVTGAAEKKRSLETQKSLEIREYRCS